MQSTMIRSLGQLRENLSNRTNANVSSVVESRIPRFRKASYREISYLDISSIDGRTGMPFPQTIAADDCTE
jgi:hypothetical protein